MAKRKSKIETGDTLNNIDTIDHTREQGCISQETTHSESEKISLRTADEIPGTTSQNAVQVKQDLPDTGGAEPLFKETPLAGALSKVTPQVEGLTKEAPQAEALAMEMPQAEALLKETPRDEALSKVTSQDEEALFKEMPKDEAVFKETPRDEALAKEILRDESISQDASQVFTQGMPQVLSHQALSQDMAHNILTTDQRLAKEMQRVEIRSNSHDASRVLTLKSQIVNSQTHNITTDEISNLKPWLLWTRPTKAVAPMDMNTQHAISRTSQSVAHVLTKHEQGMSQVGKSNVFHLESQMKHNAIPAYPCRIRSRPLPQRGTATSGFSVRRKHILDGETHSAGHAVRIQLKDWDDIEELDTECFINFIYPDNIKWHDGDAYGRHGKWKCAHEMVRDLCNVKLHQLP